MGIDARFAGLVERLRVEAERHPLAYRRKVVLAGLLGYAYVLTVLLALLAGTGAMIWMLIVARGAAAIEAKLGIFLGLSAFALIRALMIEAEAPAGILIDRAAAPDLFALLDRLRAQVNGPAIHTVYIGDEFNAAIMQQPRFMIFGNRNILTIGLPLLQGLSKDEAAAVIAHEFGHFVGGHGHWAAFIYRIRKRWMQIAERLPRGIVAAVLRLFFRRYGPWFNAYSFVLARAQEYEADRLAARALSPALAAAALIRVTTRGDRFAASWTGVWGEAVSRPDPSTMPYRTAASYLREEAEDELSVLEYALERMTGLDDTHPCLKDRLAAIGSDPVLPPPFAASAAETLLGGRAEELADELDRNWWNAHGNWWRTLHQMRQDEIAERDALAARLESGDARKAEYQRHAELVAEMDGASAAIPFYRKLLDRFPDAADVRYQLGAALLYAGDDAGIVELETAAQIWRGLGAPAYRTIIGHLHATGRQDEAEPYFVRLDAAEAHDEQAAAEANQIDAQAELLPLLLSDEDRRRIADTLAGISGLKSLRAARRKLLFGDRDQIIFLAYPGKGTDPQQLVDAITPILLEYGDTLGFGAHGTTRWLGKKLRAIPGNQLVPAVKG
ncbi:M48 family metallopeptidase [Sphingomonas oleivorans]|uniref:M48 family metallopeptidase n=1 Tax=Sphingomonas oleivorans TaxID=1735121 RepID=UPI0013FD6D77|nr:M48 family metallopeptidase [Sphingomonas oleivorans]